METKNNPILHLSSEFSLLLIDYWELLRQQKQFEILTQVLRSGTAVGANVFEAQSSESRNDFIHKMKIACKESLETE
jgi:four helix bundle protein